jgi:Terminase RNaseH-like domain
MRYYLGLDLGQAADYTALVIAERLPAEENPAYHLRHLQRFKIGTPYPQIVESVKTLTERPEFREHCVLAIDATGVGAPVVDMVEAAELPCPLYSVHIHGGDRVTNEGRHYRVPKRDLVSAVQVLLQNARLKIAEGLPETKLLIKELLNFRVKIAPTTAHDSYAAWREADHDDLVLATALAL